MSECLNVLPLISEVVIRKTADGLHVNNRELHNRKKFQSFYFILHEKKRIKLSNHIAQIVVLTVVQKAK